MAYIGVSPSNGVRRVHTYTATASQTTFSGAGAEGTSLSYKDSNFVDVYQNGIKLGDADYTSTSGTSIVLAQGASVDDLVVVVVFDVFSVADTVSKADGGTFDGNVTMAGTLDVTGNQTNSGNLTVSGAFTSQGIDDNADATAMTIDSSENVMIGTTSHDGNGMKLQVEHSSSATDGRVQAHGFSCRDNYGSISNLGNGIASVASNTLAFATNSTERLRLNNSGMFMLNGVNAVARFVISQDTQALNMCFLQNTNSTHGGNFFVFSNSSGVTAGTINQNSSTTVAYNTSSDYRLKENVNYNFDATTRLKQLKPARFNWIEDETNTLVDGFLAHEVSSIVPEAVTGEKDATKDVPNVVLNADGTVKAQGISEEDWTQGKSDGIYENNTTWVASKNIIDAQGIDQSKLVPLLVKTIQELEARITALENAE